MALIELIKVLRYFSMYTNCSELRCFYTKLPVNTFLIHSRNFLDYTNNICQHFLSMEILLTRKLLYLTKFQNWKEKKNFFREIYNLFGEIIFVKLFWVLLPTFVRSFDIKNLSKKLPRNNENSFQFSKLSTW